MGWTSYQATHYNSKGNIDRKAECDYIMNRSGYTRVIKSSMVGAIYYAACSYTNKFFEEFKDKEHEYKDKVFAVVFITSVDNKDPYFNFSYKDMSEDMGPCYYDCPNSILKLLTPTDSEFANDWREACKKRVERKKVGLGSLPLGATIEIVMPFDTISYKEGEHVLLTKCRFGYNKRAYWFSTTHRFSNNLIKRFEEEGNYKVVVSN